MKRLINSNKSSSLSLHYNWNTNKVVKRQLLEQMGDWYVQDLCLPMEEQQNTTLNTAACCAAQPLIRCHYSDLPSVIPCPDSPSFNKDNARKFWSRRWFLSTGPDTTFWSIYEQGALGQNTSKTTACWNIDWLNRTPHNNSNKQQTDVDAVGHGPWQSMISCRLGLR